MEYGWQHQCSAVFECESVRVWLWAQAQHENSPLVCDHDALVTYGSSVANWSIRDVTFPMVIEHIDSVCSGYWRWALRRLVTVCVHGAWKQGSF